MVQCWGDGDVGVGFVGLNKCRIGSWNVNKGLRKLEVVHRRKLIYDFEVLCLNEIGVWSEEDFKDKIGELLWNEFIWFINPRRNHHIKARSASGGFAVGIK